jgi:hypothetical protein
MDKGLDKFAVKTDIKSSPLMDLCADGPPGNDEDTLRSTSHGMNELSRGKCAFAEEMGSHERSELRR